MRNGRRRTGAPARRPAGIHGPTSIPSLLPVPPLVNRAGISTPLTRHHLPRPSSLPPPSFPENIPRSIPGIPRSLSSTSTVRLLSKEIYPVAPPREIVECPIASSFPVCPS